MLSPFIIKSSPLRNDSHMCHDKYSPVGAPHRDHFGLALWDGCAEWEELVPSLKGEKVNCIFFLKTISLHQQVVAAAGIQNTK